MTDLQSNWKSILIAFNALTITSVALIVLTLLLPLFCKSVHKRTPWYSHMLSWFIFSITLLLLLGHQRDPNPPAGLCFVQTALLYATPPLVGFSLACYLLDINLALVAIFGSSPVGTKKIETSVVLGFFPWIVFWAIIIEVSFYFATTADEFVPAGHPDLHLFCHYNSKPTNTITGILILLAAVILFFTKVWTVILLVRNFRSYEWTSTRISTMVLFACIRACVFTGIALVGIFIGQGSFTVKNNDIGWGLALPMLPITAALMYGIHTDVLHCLIFRKKSERPEEREKGKPELELRLGNEAGQIEQ